MSRYKNNIAKALSILAFVIWGAYVLIGIMAGSTLNTINDFDNFRVGYSGGGGGYIIVTILYGGIACLFTLGFAEGIELLQDILNSTIEANNRKAQSVVPPVNPQAPVAPMQPMNPQTPVAPVQQVVQNTPIVQSQTPTQNIGVTVQPPVQNVVGTPVEQVHQQVVQETPNIQQNPYINNEQVDVQDSNINKVEF